MEYGIRKFYLKGKVLCTCQNNHTLIYLTAYSSRQLGPKCKSPLAKSSRELKLPLPCHLFFFFKLYLDSQAHLVLVFCLFFDSWFFGDFSVSSWVLTSYFIEFLFSLHLYPGSEVRVLKCEITTLSELWVTVCLRKEITFALFSWLSMNHLILFICFIH